MVRQSDKEHVVINVNKSKYIYQALSGAAEHNKKWGGERHQQKITTKIKSW